MRTILVVDDSQTSRRLSRYFLNSIGYYNLDECADGQAAINKLQASKPPFELVVADWHMPHMSGLELLRQVRADRMLSKLPVILANRAEGVAVSTFEPQAGLSGR